MKIAYLIVFILSAVLSTLSLNQPNAQPTIMFCTAMIVSVIGYLITELEDK